MQVRTLALGHDGLDKGIHVGSCPRGLLDSSTRRVAGLSTDLLLIYC
jgi:hypothetical protein